MKVQLRFDSKPPIEIDGAWSMIVEVDGEEFELIPQFADRDIRPRILLRARGISERLLVIPSASNSITFGVVARGKKTR